VTIWWKIPMLVMYTDQLREAGLLPRCHKDFSPQLRLWIGTP
jgi:hypothetical protein